MGFWALITAVVDDGESWGDMARNQGERRRNHAVSGFDNYYKVKEAQKRSIIRVYSSFST